MESKEMPSWGMLMQVQLDKVVRGICATTSIAAAIDTLIWIELPIYVVLREDLKNNDFR